MRFFFRKDGVVYIFQLFSEKSFFVTNLYFQCQIKLCLKLKMKIKRGYIVKIMLSIYIKWKKKKDSEQKKYGIKQIKKFLFIFSLCKNKNSLFVGRRSCHKTSLFNKTFKFSRPFVTFQDSNFQKQFYPFSFQSQDINISQSEIS